MPPKPALMPLKKNLKSKQLSFLSRVYNIVNQFYFIQIIIMKRLLLYTSAITIFALASCEYSGNSNHTSANHDSLRMVEIADSINKTRGIATPGNNITTNDTADEFGINGITRGMTEGLNKVQEGLTKMKKVTDVSTARAKEISDGIKKTKDAVNKTIDDAKKTINGE